MYLCTWVVCFPLQRTLPRLNFEDFLVMCGLQFSLKVFPPRWLIGSISSNFLNNITTQKPTIQVLLVSHPVMFSLIQANPTGFLLTPRTQFSQVLCSLMIYSLPNPNNWTQLNSPHHVISVQGAKNLPEKEATHHTATEKGAKSRGRRASSCCAWHWGSVLY